MARRFLRLGPSQVAAATQCVAETFAMQSRTDPFTALFGYSAQHWASMAASFIRRSGSAARPLSVVAIGPSGDVEGVMLNEDWVTPTPLEYQKLGTVRNSLHHVLVILMHDALANVGMASHTRYFQGASFALRKQASRSCSAVPSHALFYVCS